jgi:hypothetical protein
MDWTCGTHGAENCTQAFGGETEGKTPLGRFVSRWEDMAMGGDWTVLAQDTDRWRAVVSTVMNLRVP